MRNSCIVINIYRGYEWMFKLYVVFVLVLEQIIKRLFLQKFCKIPVKQYSSNQSLIDLWLIHMNNVSCPEKNTFCWKWN